MRIKWIDILKGILMVFVVLGHSNFNYNIIKIIYAFHMPVFFMVSGYLLKLDSIDSAKKWIKSKTLQYMTPYMSFLIVNSCIDFDNKSKIDLAKNILRGGYGGTLVSGVYWFTTNLFIGSIVFAFVEKQLTKKAKILLYVVAFLGATFMSYKCVVNGSELGDILIKLPWGLFNIPLVVCYLKLGRTFHNMERTFENIKWISWLSLLLVVMLGTYIILSFPERKLPIDMKYSVYGNLLINILMPLSMWFILRSLCKWLENVKVIETTISYIGQASLVIMYTHLFVNKLYIRFIGGNYNAISYVVTSVCCGCFIYTIFCKNSILSYLFLGKKYGGNYA